MSLDNERLQERLQFLIGAGFVFLNLNHPVVAFLQFVFKVRELGEVALS